MHFGSDVGSKLDPKSVNAGASEASERSEWRFQARTKQRRSIHEAKANAKQRRSKDEAKAFKLPLVRASPPVVSQMCFPVRLLSRFKAAGRGGWQG